jgi:hypothetical protein
MHVPHDPTPPTGAPDSVRVFRAGANYYKVRLFGWIVAQLFAIAGIVFWISMIGVLERNLDEARRMVQLEALRAKTNALRAAAAKAIAPGTTAATPPPAEAPTPGVAPIPATPEPPAAKATPDSKNTSDPKNPKATKKKGRSGPNLRGAQQLLNRFPPWIIWGLRTLELLGIVGFIAQLPFTLAVLRLDFELRWYIVTDRSLRIRSGIWKLQEMTMSFANIQQVSVTQGPIQRLLKISDVQVQSAGGGGSEGGSHGGHGESLHTGIFHGVDNAQEIRDLVLERLRQFRATGLGDPDDAHEMPAAAAAVGTATHPALGAAKELLAEARALRAAL